MKKPYVGVSGVVSREQADELMYYAERSGLTRHRQILLGVKAVHKTQWLDIENTYGPDWYPVGRSINEVADGQSYSGEFWVAQLSMDQVAAADEGVTDYEQRFVRKLTGRTSGWLDGVQFDLLPWDRTDYRQLFEKMKSDKPDLEILLQCQGSIMSDNDPSEVGALLDKYRDYVDHVLFDASHGTGAEMDSKALQPYIAEASEREWLGVGLAGGLNAERVPRHLGRLLFEFPNLSFDAEGQLHVNADGSRGLNMDATAAYFQAAAEVIIQSGKPLTP